MNKSSHGQGSSEGQGFAALSSESDVCTSQTPRQAVACFILNETMAQMSKLGADTCMRVGVFTSPESPD